MITQKLKEAVVKEALLLRKHATKEERAKLDFNELRGDNAYHCVYGQMTGSCYSDRSRELHVLCAKPYSKSVHHYTGYLNHKFEIGNEGVSSLEFYLNQEGAKNDVLINLLKS